MGFVAGLSVRVLTSEGARVHGGHRSVMDALVDLVRRERLPGITVLRAVEGYSAHGGLHRSSWVDVSDDLPLVIEIVDRVEAIERVLPEITALLRHGVVTVSEVRFFALDDSPEKAGG
jgi:uncharacterized protein